MPLPGTTGLLPYRLASVVPRPQLMARLHGALSCALTLVTAPAGYGKTTLLQSWIAELEAIAVVQPTAAAPAPQLTWLALAPSDDEPAHFLATLVAALAEIPGLELGLVRELAASLEVPARAVLTALSQSLAAVPAHVVLVLDDYHLITAPAIHASLAEWLARMPPNLHLVIASRTLPPLPLARLRGRGQLAEIGANELQLTPAETATLLRELLGDQLHDDGIASLHERTGGWAAGLQLAALALRARPEADHNALLAQLAGHEHFSFDYLRDEVLCAQPPAIRRFLLRTAVLDELSEELCDAVVGGRTARRSLAYLVANQLFVLPVDPWQRHVRYHPLFHDLLRSCLRETPAQIPALHRRAAAWYEEQGQIAAAVEHRLRAGDHAAVARLIEAHGDRMWTQAEMQQLCRWVEQLPWAVQVAHPRLRLLYSWALLMCGQPARAEACLDMVAAQLDREPAAGSELTGLLLAIRAPIRALRDPAAALADYQAAAAQLPVSAVSWRSAVALGSGFAALAAGDLTRSGLAFAQASALCREAGNLYAAVYASYYRGRVIAEQGQLRQAAATFEDAVTLARAPESPTPLLASWGYLGLSEVCHERNDLSTATAHALEALQMGRQRENAETFSRALLCLARINTSLGQLDEALVFLGQAEGAARAAQLSRVLSEVQLCQARAWLAQQNLPAAARVAAELDAPEIVRGSPEERACLLLRARLWIAQGQLPEAAAILRGLIDGATTYGAQRLEAHVLLAHCLCSTGERAAGLAMLHPALTQGRLEGYQRAFLDVGPPLVPLLRAALQHEIEVAFTAALLQSFTLPPTDLPPTRPALVEPLTATERALLELVAAGLANQQLAETLHISLNTVKWHLKNIYGKLGACSRTAAVAAARELRLLSER